jgi:adenosine deaminase
MACARAGLSTVAYSRHFLKERNMVSLSSLSEGEVLTPILFASTAWLVVQWQRSRTRRRGKVNSIDETIEDHEEAVSPSSSGVKRKSMGLVRYLTDYAESTQQISKWDSYTDDEEIFIQEFPKIELHVHLDGSFDPDFLFKYLKEHPDSIYCLPVETSLPWEPGRKLAVRAAVQNCETSQEYHRLCSCRGYRSLHQMLNCFEIFLPLVRGNLELIEHLAFDFCQRQWEQHVVYTEVRYSPHLLADGFEIEGNSSDKVREVDAVMVLNAVTKGLRRGSNQFGIIVNQILCAITWRPDWAMSTLDLVQKHQHDYPCATVGVDVAAGEEHYDKEKFPHLYTSHYEMIQRAKELGIPIAIHAGEATDQARENVRRAISEYGASRVGHGYSMAKSDELMYFVRQSGCHIEVCPTSSVETGGWVYDGEVKDWQSHPCMAMLRCGVPFSFNSDDPAVFHTSLAWQYRIALAKMGLTRAQLVQTNLDGIDAAFCTPEQKEDLRANVQRYAQKSARPIFRRARSEAFVDRVHLNSNVYV